MSELIRGLCGGWTAPPGRAVDIRIPKTPDTYSFLQNQIESEQRQGQNNMNRTIRTTNANAARPSSPPRPQYPLFPTTIITLPVR